MLLRRRATWLEGRYANVDGIPFTLPVRTRTSPALFAAFSIDPAAAQAMLPGQELHACRVLTRGILVVAVVDYLDTTIGTYVEFCIGVLCTRGRRPAPPLLPLLLQQSFGLGVYIYDLPVSTQISVKGGLGIWGMPKRQANLDFRTDGVTATSQYDLDGRIVARIDIPQVRAVLPFAAAGAGYGSFRGLLGKSYINMRGRCGLSLRPRDARLLIGDHPRAETLKTLDIDPRPLVAGFVPRLDGVLGDHIETWFLTAGQPPGQPAVGMAEVIDRPLSQDRLPPPDRAWSDRLLRELTPDQCVGRAARPALEAKQMGSAMP